MTATDILTDQRGTPFPLKFVDFPEICRVCLLSTNLQALETTHFDTLFNVLKVQISGEINLPKNICEVCLNELNIISAFIKKFKASTDILESVLSKVKSDGTSEILKAEDCLSENGMSIDEHNEEDTVKERRAPVKRLLKRKRIVKKEKRIYLCSICGKHLTRESTLKDHLRMHTGEKKFECQICGFKFTIKRNLTRHLSVHGEEKKFQCNYCGKRLTQKKYLEKHIRNFHKEPKPRARKEWKPICFCPTCGRGFASKSHLERHVVTHIGYKNDKGESDELKKEFLCTHCGKQFISKCNLERHIVISHTGEKRYECKICGNKYTIKSSLDYHMNVHEGRKPFACHFCSKSFRQPSALRKHILVHTGERKFKCHICDKAFKTSTHLRTHFKIHALV